jgi:hypothetical protein
MSTVTGSNVTDEVGAAKSEIAIAREYAAAPLLFSNEAATLLTQRDDGQLRANLPRIVGGWTTVRDGVLRAAGLTGEIAKTLARFEDTEAEEITVEQATLARTVAERACKLKLAKDQQRDPDELSVEQGYVCGP